MNSGPAFYFLGVDGAASEGATSDDGAMVVVRATPRGGLAPSDVRSDWWCDAVYARTLTSADKASARQWSGLIHRQHQRWQFERIVMDPGGGGTFIKRELAQPRQLINGVETEVVPIGDLVDAPRQMARGHFILHLFRRRDPGLVALWPELSGEGSMSGDDTLKDALLAETREALAGQWSRFPRLHDDWLADPAARAELHGWTLERRQALQSLSQLVGQAKNVMVLTNPDGTLALTKRGARQFATAGKDDLVYAWMYAQLAFWIWLKTGAVTAAESGEDAVGFSGRAIA